MKGMLNNLGRRALTGLIKRLDPEPERIPEPDEDDDGAFDLVGDDEWVLPSRADIDAVRAERQAEHQDDPRSPEERAYADQFSSETALQRARRQAREYFSIIESIEKERDALWKMYRVEVSEHLNAQALLERQLMNSRQQLARAVAMLNKMREEQELEPINSPKNLTPYEGEPIGTARKYADDMIELCDRFQDLVEDAKPEMVDGAKERDRVASDD